MPDTRIVRGEVVLPETEFGEGYGIVIVEVEDVTRADAPSAVIAEYRRAGVLLRKGASVPFAVPVPEDAVDERKHYSIRVHVDLTGSGEVEVGDFVSTASHPVLTHGHGETVRIPVKKV